MIDVPLALVIAFFSGVQGYSTLSQVRLAKERDRIEDLRNQLERAYGPLYTLLNKFEVGVDREKNLPLWGEEKRYLDEIIATHSFMFPSEVYDLWLKKIQPLEPERIHPQTSRTVYRIPLGFRDKINEEYDRKVKEYYRLLKKE